MMSAQLERDNRRLRDENATLRETIRQFEEERMREASAPLPEGVPDLTPQEEAVFRTLLRTSGVVPRERLYQALYGGEADRFPRIIDTHLSHLRRKLAPAGYSFVTSRGRGWRMVKAETANA